MVEIEIEVPYHFVCPISLQLMRDPVTVSSGITYDRDNIEKWLFSCKNTTCPVSKHPLNGTYLTPNHTLRRLIQAWCTLNASKGVERIPTPKPPTDQTRIAKLLREAKTSPAKRVKCLIELRAIAMESEWNRHCLESAGAVDFLASVIRSCSDNYDGFELGVGRDCDEALGILHYLRVTDDQLKGLILDGDNRFMESLVKVLKHGSYQSRGYSTMLLKSVFQVADPIHLLSISKEIFAELVRVLRDQVSQQATKSALKLLVEICPWGRNRIKAVEMGGVPVLIELLVDMSSDKRASELILVVLDQLCGCAEGRAELVNHGGGLAVVSKKMLRVSHMATDRAVRILSSITKFSATSRVLQEMLEVGVVAKICLLLQVDCSFKSKERAREMLMLHSRVWRNSLCVPHHLMSSYPS